MNSDELRKIQQPLKEQYRSHPEKALITLRAEGQLGDGISCKVETGKAMVEAGLHPATGGTGMLACSGDLLLEALVACAGVTLQAVATAINVPVTGGKVRAEGDLDFRGTLSVDKTAKVGFERIRLTFDIESTASGEEIAQLIKLTERYCVVYQTLKGGVEVKVKSKISQ
jgi:uncharacterized OsmC-like protein